MSAEAARTYDAYAEFYDSCVQGRRGDLDVYASLVPRGGRVIEIGCGTGRVMEALLDCGAERLLGVDVSQGMLVRAADRLVQARASGLATLLHADAGRDPFPEPGSWDLAIVSWFTVNYLVELAELRALLVNLRAALRPGGRVVLEAFHPKPLGLPGSRWESTTEFDHQDGRVRRVDVRRLHGDIEERTQTYHHGARPLVAVRARRRHYPPAVLARSLTATGFTDVMVRYDLDPGGFVRFTPRAAAPPVKFMLLAEAS